MDCIILFSQNDGPTKDITRLANPAPSATPVHQAGPDLNYPAQMTHLTFSIWKLPKRVQSSLQPIEVFNDLQGIKTLFSALTSVAQLVQHGPMH